MTIWGILGGLGSFVLGAIIAVCAEPARRRIFRAKLELDFKPRKGEGTGYITHTPANIVTTDGRVIGRAGAYYLRVSVRNNNCLGVVAKSCRPLLLEIERQVSEDQYETIHHDPLPLAWSYIGVAPRDLPLETAFYFDFAELNSLSNRLTPQTTPKPLIWEDLLSQPGIYRFTVAIFGENAPLAPLQICVDWNGQWDSVKAGVDYPYVDLSFLSEDNSIVLTD